MSLKKNPNLETPRDKEIGILCRLTLSPAALLQLHPSPEHAQHHSRLQDSAELSLC